MTALHGILAFLLFAGTGESDRHELGQPQKWCGARAVWLIARAKGEDVDFDTVKKMCDPQETSGGLLSLARMKTVSGELGIPACACEGDLDWLGRHLPAIATQLPPPGVTDLHYVVVVEIREDHVRLADPAYGDVLLARPIEQFEQLWTGHALIFDGPCSTPIEVWASRLVTIDMALIGLAGLSLGYHVWKTRRSAVRSQSPLASPDGEKPKSS
ncbi:MAG: hypothetical protein KDA80_05535 [Planctomycetaceae bacterium]|nr:hypothetical protein [Planctomycetaceae bacterium]